MALDSFSQWIELWPAVVAGSIPGQGHILVAGLNPQPRLGVCRRQLLSDSLPLYTPLLYPRPLK